MRPFKKYLVPGLAVFLLMMAVSCHRKETTNGYSRSDGVYFKLLGIGDGKAKADTADYLWLDAACSTLKDSVFWDSRNNALEDFFIRQNSFSFAKHLYTFSEGDSVQYLVPVRILFKEMFHSDKIAYFCEKDSCVKWSVKIRRMLSADQLGPVRDSLIATLAQKDIEQKGVVNNYVFQNFQAPVKLAEDAYLEITQSATGDSITNGTHLSVLFKGSFLDGRPADLSCATKPFDFTLGQEGQVIEGLRRAFYRLKKGEKAKIILPSRLAFGNKGSSDGSIPPYTPLIYEVEILKK